MKRSRERKRHSQHNIDLLDFSFLCEKLRWDTDSPRPHPLSDTRWRWVGVAYSWSARLEGIGRERGWGLLRNNLTSSSLWLFLTGNERGPLVMEELVGVVFVGVAELKLDRPNLLIKYQTLMNIIKRWVMHKSYEYH